MAQKSPKKKDKLPDPKEHSFMELEEIQKASNKVVCKCIRELNQHLNKNGPYDFPLIYYSGAVPILIDLMDRSVLIARLCLNVLYKLMKASQVVRVFYDEPILINRLINVYVQVVDSFVKEYTSLILIILHEDSSIHRKYLSPEMFSAIFHVFATEKDPDVVRNSLQLLLCILNSNGSLVFLCENSEKCNLNLLFPMHRSEFEEIRFLTFCVMQNLTYKISGEIKDLWREFRVMVKYFGFFYEPGYMWDDTQNIVVDVIRQCLCRSMFVYTDFYDVNLQRFILTTPIDDSPLSYARLAIIEQMLKNTEGALMLESIGVSFLLDEYLKLDCDLCNVLVCESISTYIYITGNLETFMTDHVVCEIGRITKKTHLDWNPYRECVINIIHHFIMASNEIMVWLYNCGALAPLKSYFLSRDNISKTAYIKVLEMYQIISSQKRYQSYILEDIEILKRLIEMIHDISDNIKRKTFYLLLCSLQLETCRKWFNEMNGVEMLCKIYGTGSCLIKDNIVSIFKMLFTKPSIAKKFINHGYLPILQEDLRLIPIRENTFKEKVQSLIETLYDYDISYKFHDTRKLSINNLIDTGFHIYTGYNIFQKFPLIRDTSERKYDHSYTVIAVVFNNKNLRTLVKKRRRSHGRLSSRFRRLSVTEKKEKVFVLTSYLRETRVPYTDQLDKMVDLLKRLFKQDVPLVSKVQLLADFVNRQMSGSAIHGGPSLADYESHISNIKTVIKSNVIPLSLIRLGFYVERALLFKVLADKLNIPCTLNRGNHIYVAWNEVPLPRTEQIGIKSVSAHVVDLMHSIGALYIVGSAEATLYCSGQKLTSSQLFTLNMKVFEYISSKENLNYPEFTY